MLIEVEMLVLLVLFSGASALDSSLSFSFSKKPSVFRKNDDVCRVCYGEYDCLSMEKARCEYNAATAAIFYNDEGQEFQNSGVKTQIDIMLNNLLLHESIMENFEECVPIISSYSNCNRENICLGCQTCRCNMEGRWNCSLVQQCSRQETKVDHRVLVLTMQMLKSGHNSFRGKRSNEAAEDKSTLQRTNYEELSQWLYGEKSIQQKHEKTFTKMVHLKEPSTKTTRNYVAPETVALNEVWGVISLDIKNSSTSDLMSPYNTDKPDPSNDIDSFLQMLAFEERKETPATIVDETTTMYIKLNNDNRYVATKDTDNLNEMGKDANEKLNRQILVEHDANLMDSLGILNLINLIKRDNQMNNIVGNRTVEMKNMTIAFKNLTVEIKNSTNEPKSQTILEKVLRDKVIDPIGILITNNYKEIKQLSNIKESLIQFMNNHNFNSTLHYETKFDSDKVNSTSETKLQPYNNFRRTNSNNNIVLVEKYLKKLKVDIIEVVRDILGIRKVQKSKTLPYDLKLLLQAITYFLKKNSIKPEEGKSNNAAFRGNHNNFRRQFESTNININENPVREAVLKMLELIDHNMPTSNALSPLSPRAKRVLKRIVNENYIDDFAVEGLKANGVNNNMINNLRTIGLQWQELANNIVNCAAADRLYNMKLLYFSLSHDIIKMTDASLSNFFYNRRMSVVDENEQKDIVHRIDTILRNVDSVIKYYISNENKAGIAQNTKQKLSLFKKINSILKSSKNKLIKILHKRRMPSVIKEMARKKMEEERKRKLLQVMRKWQDNLDIVSFRNKRSISEYTKLKNRIKNIIPHYLRGKLNPALDAKGIGVRKKTRTYKTRPKNKAQLTTVKIATTTAKIRAASVRLNKMKRKH